MKKLVLAAVAFSLFATPAAFAKPYHPQPPHHSVQKNYKQNHHWARGQRLDRGARRVVIREGDYGRYHLRRPPHGHQWVRVDNDFILVATATGIISSILYAATH